MKLWTILAWYLYLFVQNWKCRTSTAGTKVPPGHPPLPLSTTRLLGTRSQGSHSCWLTALTAVTWLRLFQAIAKAGKAVPWKDKRTKMRNEENEEKPRGPAELRAGSLFKCFFKSFDFHPETVTEVTALDCRVALSRSRLKAWRRCPVIAIGGKMIEPPGEVQSKARFESIALSAKALCAMYLSLTGRSTGKIKAAFKWSTARITHRDPQLSPRRTAVQAKVTAVKLRKTQFKRKMTSLLMFITTSD